MTTETTCEHCGHRATREEMIVFRGGAPPVREVVIRCWRVPGLMSKSMARAYCPIVRKELQPA